MQMTGEQRIAAPRQRVWEALNDPEVLRQCIPGCQSLEQETHDSFVALAEIKIGPIGARFKGAVQLSELDPPNGYTISGSGSGGIAGSARGGARVRLADDPVGGTVVAYTVDAEVGGRMAQLGGPIIDATAKNLAARFFTKFGEIVGAEADQAAAPASVVGTAPASPPVAGPSMPAAVPVAASAATSQPSPIWGWIAAMVLALLAGFVAGRSPLPGAVVLTMMMLAVVAAGAGYITGRGGAGR